MKKLAELALAKEVKKIVLASNYKIVKEAMAKLSGLADILDSIGERKDADRVDGIIKEAQNIWDVIFGGGAGLAATKDSGGKTILDAIRSGNLGSFFSKDTLVKLLTNFLAGAGIALLADSLVDILLEKLPILKWFGDPTVIKAIVMGALSYAILNSDFVSHLVDGIVDEIEKVIGVKKEQIKPAPVLQPAQPNTDTATFKVEPAKTS